MQPLNYTAGVRAGLAAFCLPSHRPVISFGNSDTVKTFKNLEIIVPLLLTNLWALPNLHNLLLELTWKALCSRGQLSA